MKVAEFRRRSMGVEESPAHYTADPTTAIARIKRGLPVGEFDALRELLGLTVEELGRKVGISIATLSRRRQGGLPLDVEHGDRLMRYSRLYWQAVALHDGEEATARQWLRRPAPALGGESPLEFADTELGARAVEQLIGRIEHGVYT